jgi:hypothetical protein
MWFNAIIRAKSYQFLYIVKSIILFLLNIKKFNYFNIITLQVLHGCRQPVPWGVRLTPSNGRNSYFILVNFIYFRLIIIQLIKTADDRSEEGENYVKPLWPLWTGLHTCYNDKYKKLYNKVIWSKSIKFIVCSDYRLQFVYMKVESQVIVNQHVTVN